MHKFMWISLPMEKTYTLIWCRTWEKSKYVKWHPNTINQTLKVYVRQRQEQHNFHPCIEKDDNYYSSQSGWIPTTTMRKVLWEKQKTKWMNYGLSFSLNSQWESIMDETSSPMNELYVECHPRYFDMCIVQVQAFHTLPLLVKLAWWIRGGGMREELPQKDMPIVCNRGFSGKVTPGAPLCADKARVPAAAQARPIVVPTGMGQTHESIPVHKATRIIMLRLVWSWCGHLNRWLLP